MHHVLQEFLPFLPKFMYDNFLSRDSLHSHEKELERTSQNIKELIKEGKNLVGAANNLSRAQRSLSDHLVNFKFDCIDDQLAHYTRQPKLQESIPIVGLLC